MKFSRTSARALQIIRENPGIGITTFSKLMWPDNPLWEVSRSDGKGYGYKMIRTGQQYLGRLVRAGWISERYFHNGVSKIDRKFFITELGSSLLLDIPPGATIINSNN